MLGMYFVITKLLGRTEMKVMVTAVGTFSVGSTVLAVDGLYTERPFIL